jgi:hypothetical protein
LLILTEKHRLRVLKNWILRRIFGSKRDKVIGEWRTLHNEELYVLYPSSDVALSNKIKSNETGRACSTYRGKKRCIQGFGGET